MAITTYNRPDLTIESFKEIYKHQRLVEICISDDCSTSENMHKLFKNINEYPAVWIKSNEVNIGMMNNKIKAVEFADADFVLLADSDNIFKSDYLEALPSELSEHTIYMPDFAEPRFDFREFSGKTFDKNSIKPYLDDPIMQVMLNTCNYVVPRENFINAFQDNPEIKGSDTIWINYNWLKSGYKICVVLGMKYFHRVHKDSGWLENADYNMTKGKEIIELIRNL